MQQGNKKRAAILFGAGVVLMIAAVVLFTFTPPEKPNLQPTQTRDTRGLPYPEVERITAEDAKAAYERGEVLFVDVRTEAEFAEMKLPGAVNIPWDLMETRYQMLEPDDSLILYCGCPAEETSAGAALILLEHDFPNVYALEGGLKAWIDLGYTTE